MGGFIKLYLIRMKCVEKLDT